MKLKNLFIALLMVIGSTLMAQEKYEQAIVMQCGLNMNVMVEGQEFQKVRLNKDDIGNGDNFLPLINQVALMRKDGWEVWNSTSALEGVFIRTTYFLHRKLK